jgi:predicted amidohydrolase YtcJ
VGHDVNQFDDIEFADIVITGGLIYTAEASQPFAKALAVCGSRIVYVGSMSGVAEWIGPGTEVINGEGCLTCPGFRDAHIHPLHGSLAWVECALDSETSADAYVRKVAAFAADDVKKPVIRGKGWRQGFFPPQGPHKSLLDNMIPDRPVYLMSMDGHSAWVNSCALRLAGVDKGTCDPAGGLIERDISTGEPTGTLREWPAMDLVNICLPAHHHDDIMGAMAVFMEMAARAGMVAIHDAGAREKELAIYSVLARQEALTLDIGASLVFEPDEGIEQIVKLMALQKQYGSELLRPLTAKIFLDGVLESHTAYLSAPYTDRPDLQGTLVWKESDLHDIVVALEKRGFSIHIHAVGDETVRLALDAFTSARKINNIVNLRHQIAHLDLLTDADMERMRRLSIIANMQPLWFYEDESFREVILPAIGVERAQRLYRLCTLLSRGAKVCFSSDWPYSGGLSTFKPLEAIQIGLTRKSLEGKEREPFLAAERVELRQLIDGFTINSAYAAFQEEETGSLKVGKRADVVVLDRNLFAIPPEEICHTRVLLTLFRGKTIFRQD